MQTRRRSRLGPPAAFLLLAVVTYAFSLVMTRLEPVNGDGWKTRLRQDNAFDVVEVYDELRLQHNRVNPRLGQLFTILTNDPIVHSAVSPLVMLGTWLLLFVHAIGRLPRLGSARDCYLLMACLGGVWMAVPNPGVAFYYRPVLTNYVYSTCVVLLFLLPFRLAPRQRSGWFTALASAGLGLAGVAVGKLNEHTGPTIIVLLLVSIFLSMWHRRLRELAWKSAATLGFVVGYLLLFFAPGQQMRYGALAEQTVVETISARGFQGSVDLFGSFLGSAAPVFAFIVAVLALHFVSRPEAAEKEATTERNWWPIVYLVAAVLITLTAFAAPKHETRLFVAPALLLCVVAVMVLDRLALAGWARATAGLAALAVHGAYMAVLLSLYSSLHAQELVRFTRAEAAEPDSHHIVQPYGEKSSALYYGDTLATETKHQMWMARYYGLKSVTIAKKKNRLRPRRDPTADTRDQSADGSLSEDGSK